MGRRLEIPGGGWYPRNLPAQVMRDLPKGTQCFQKTTDARETLRAMVVDAGTLGWNLSLTSDNRLPTLGECLAARWHLIPPEIQMGIILPRTAEEQAGGYTVNMSQVPVRFFEDPAGVKRGFSWKRRK